MNATKLFNESLPAALAANPEKAKSVGAKFQFNIAGAGEWHLDLTQTGPVCEPGSAPADVIISISDADFQTLAANPQVNAMKMMFTGKLKIDGNKMVAMKLKDVFDYVK